MEWILIIIFSVSTGGYNMQKSIMPNEYQCREAETAVIKNKSVVTAICVKENKPNHTPPQ